MTEAVRQKLFNYFYDEHGIMLMDGDYNEIIYILSEGQTLITTDNE